MKQDLLKQLLSPCVKKYEDIANEDPSTYNSKSFGDALKADGVIPSKIGDDYGPYKSIQREFFYTTLNSCVNRGSDIPGISFIPDWHKL